MTEMMEKFFELLGTGVLFISVIVLVAILARLVENRIKKSTGKNKRQEDNLAIIDILLDYVTENPDQRFGQALRNIGVLQDVGVKESSQSEWELPDYYIDRLVIHEEPEVILKRVKETLANQNNNVIVIKKGEKK